MKYSVDFLGAIYKCKNHTDFAGCLNTDGDLDMGQEPEFFDFCCKQVGGIGM